MGNKMDKVIFPTSDYIEINPPTKSICGGIASFSDGGNAPIPSLTASIEPLIGGNNNPPSSENIKPLSGQTSMQIVDMALPANYQPSSDGKIHLAWNNGSTNYDMPFNVCQTETVKDSNNNDVDVCDIESHYVLPFDCVYDDPEAIIASETDLAAGDYYFKIVNDAWGNNNGKYVQFTLTEDLTAGKQIRKKSGGYNAAIENCTLGIFTNGADRTGTELAFTVSTTEPSSGTSLGQTDGTSYCNHWHCVVLGYNRWKYSAVRQYLNSDKAAGSWWTQQHKWDVKPAYADTKDGFLKGFDPELLHYMQVTKVTTARNNVFNSGDTPLGGMDETYDRVFLISLEQSYITPQISGEGEYWEYYKRLLGRTTPASTGATYARLIKYDLAAQTTACYRWLRSANRGNANLVWLVYTSGTVGNYYANGGLRLAPCLRIGLSALNKYTVNFKDASNNPLTVVGGQLKINNGQASVDVYPYYASYNGETLTGEWISDRDEYTEGGTPTTGAQVLNIGGTPTTYALDDISIHSFDGVNNVFASTGDVCVTYITQEYQDLAVNFAATASKLGSSNVGSATNPIYLNGGTATACTYTLGKSVPSDAVFTDTDTKVTQTETTTNADYRVLFSNSANNTTEIAGVGKDSGLIYNPSTGSFGHGYNPTISGLYAHAEGANNSATGSASHAEGNDTIAKHACQHVFGAYNIEDPSTSAVTKKGNYIEIVGNGTGATSSERSNARTLDWDGTEWLGGNLNLGGTTSDIVLTGTNNTWDGNHTSLKDALTPEVVTSSTVNLNNYTSSGKYILTGSITTKTNFPVLTPGQLEVTTWSESSTEYFCRQEFKIYDVSYRFQNDSFTRMGRSSDGGTTWVWGTWGSDQYFIAGETFKLGSGYSMHGHITSSTSRIYIYTVLPKSLRYVNITKPTSTISMDVRQNGKYVQANPYSFTIDTLNKFGDAQQPCGIEIGLKNANGTALTNGTNNDTVSAQLRANLTLSFTARTL